MRAVGIVAEYNPFHNGHKYQLDMAKRKAKAECAVIVMSGNFVQRGEPAVFDKWARARAAVLCGADLVLELNTLYALSSAENFARGAVLTLNSLGVIEDLCFGSESDDIEAIKHAARILTEEKSALDPLILSYLKKGKSYAAAREAAVAEIDSSAAAMLKSPNSILGVEYIKAIFETDAPITPHAILRAGTGHDAPIPSGAFASASAIRGLIKNGKKADSFIPTEATEVFSTLRPVFSEDFEGLILYALRHANLGDFPEAGDGLAQRLKNAMAAPTLREVLDRAKTKRHAMARIKRLLINVLLNNTLPPNTPPSYIRVLGISQRGAALLRLAKEKCALPIITKPAHAPRGDSLWELEVRATDIYNMARQRPAGEDYITSPFVLK